MEAEQVVFRSSRTDISLFHLVGTALSSSSHRRFVPVAAYHATHSRSYTTGSARLGTAGALFARCATIRLKPFGPHLRLRGQPGALFRVV